jgi:N-dimethylarginine dimethylaminohydrolase
MMTNNGFGGQSMVARLRKVLVRRPDQSYSVRDPQRWNYEGRPDLEVAQAEHDHLVDILRGEDVDVIYHDLWQPGKADAIFVQDPAIITDQGALILSPGKPLRRGEEVAMASRLREIGIPIMGRLNGGALAEGGDTLWLDSETLAVGRSFRTNEEGIRQITSYVEGLNVKVMAFDLPYHEGPASCLHLQSLISLADARTAVIFRPLMPVALYQELLDRKFRLVRIPDDEFETMGSNILAISPGVLVMLDGNPVTQGYLENLGFSVFTYKGNELSLRSEGGATCLTRPLLRRN